MAGLGLSSLFSRWRGVHPQLLAAVQYGGNTLPSGYKLRINGGYTPYGHAAHSQHKIFGRGALDVSVIGPRGPIPNRGADSTGMYQRVAVGAYDYLRRTNPALAARFAWGRQFGTRSGGSTPDIMHFDLGGPRGRLGPSVQQIASRGGGLGQVFSGAVSNDTLRGGQGRAGFVDRLAEIESNNRNIFSGVDPDVAGPGTKSQGYFQINTPTWQDFAGKAILARYPNAMSAPRDVQAQVVANIPLGRFGPRTRRMLAEQFGQMDANQTIGALAAGTGGAPIGGGMVLTGNPDSYVPPGTPSAEVANVDASGEETQEPPGDLDLSSLFGDGGGAGGEGFASSGYSGGLTDLGGGEAPPFNFAAATENPDELGLRYAQGEAGRKLSQLAQLFSVKPVGQAKVIKSQGFVG